MPNQPNHPALSFADLLPAEPLLKAIAKLGYQQPTAVQQQAIPVVLERNDLLVSAATGSGKTAAYLLPAMQLLLAQSAGKPGIRVLILAPTRELAAQIAEFGRRLTEFTALKTALITGGTDFKQQQSWLRNSAIVISTPGRLLEQLQQNALMLKDLEIMVLDEADRVLAMGQREDVLNIAGHCNKQRQTLLFSATLMNYGVIKLADRLLKNHRTIALNGRHDGHDQIEQQVMLADDNDHKQKLLTWLLAHETYDKALVFTNTRKQADCLQGPLRGQKFRAAVLHGELEPKERKRIMALFRDGVVNVLISTDLAARGLDIEGINLVINFDPPRNGVDYIHRIGRTGRADQPGLTVALVKSMEWNLMSGIERFLQRQFRRREITELAGHYQGPKKLKSSGKAAGPKKKATTKTKAPAEKIKRRHRDQKNIGKRRKPSGALSSNN